MEVLQRRVQLAPPPVIARQVVVRYRAASLVSFRQYLRFLQELEHHAEVLLLQVGHGEQVAHLADYLAGGPHLLAVAAEEVLPKHEPPLHALQRLQVVALLDGPGRAGGLLRNTRY